MQRVAWCKLRFLHGGGWVAWIEARLDEVLELLSQCGEGLQFTFSVIAGSSLDLFFLADIEDAELTSFRTILELLRRC